MELSCPESDESYINIQWEAAKTYFGLDEETCAFDDPPLCRRSIPKGDANYAIYSMVKHFFSWLNGTHPAFNIASILNQCRWRRFNVQKEHNYMLMHIYLCFKEAKSFSRLTLYCSHGLETCSHELVTRTTS